jgi:hypothetical protein
MTHMDDQVAKHIKEIIRRVVRRHRQVVGERDIYPGYRSESGSTRGASHVGPGLERPSAGKAMISGIGVGRTIVSRGVV